MGISVPFSSATVCAQLLFPGNAGAGCLMDFLAEIQTQKEPTETKTQEIPDCLFGFVFYFMLGFFLLLNCLGCFCTECMWVYLGHSKQRSFPVSVVLVFLA